MDDRNQIEEIKSKLDIANVILQYVPNLKRSGRNYFGLCPFHKEKTPSFSVNPELGLFKCFGCGEGGDVIKFLERIEGLDFPKALELAATKAGVTLKKTFSKESQKFKEEKEKIIEANQLSAKFFNYILLKHASGELCRKYVEKRKIDKREIDTFLIGYAPNTFNGLKGFLNKKGYQDKDLVKWGLLVEKNGKIYDKFRGRLMFPIVNHQGDTVGFSGRMIDDKTLGPKYLNSPETLVYKKSNTLFGLQQAKDTIRMDGFVILVEGNIDLLSSHKAGIKNIVAPLGTALTIEQVKLIKRYCDKVYFAYDTDVAGQKALIRSFELAEIENLESYVLDIGKFKDVDDLITTGGDWITTVENPKEIVSYLISTVAKKYDLSNTKFKTKYVSEILGYISRVMSPVARADYIKQVSEIVDINQDILNTELDNRVKSKREVPIDESIHTKPEAPIVQHITQLQNLVLEFIGLLYANKTNNTDEVYIKQVLGEGNAYKIYRFIKHKEKFNEIDKFIHLIEDVEMRPDNVITNEIMLDHTIKNLGERILKAKAKIEFKKLRSDLRNQDENALQKINQAIKLLKS